MNRTALCLEMLKLLKSRGMMSRQELADCLQTNVRNLSEFKKELEIAGYMIESTTGKYGGYRLIEDNTLILPSLSKEEQLSLKEATSYLKAHADFAYGSTFQTAMDKILASTIQQEFLSGIYLETNSSISKRMYQYLDFCREAISKRIALELEYKSLQASELKKVILFPYELVYYQNAYYVIGYVLHAKAYRTYKFSDERMKSCRLMNQLFTRDLDFCLQDHIGVGLMKNQVIELKLTVYDEFAILLSERIIGVKLDGYFHEDGSYYLHLLIDGEMQAEQFLLSLGTHVVLHEPTEWIIRMKERVNQMSHNWRINYMEETK